MAHKHRRLNKSLPYRRPSPYPTGAAVALCRDCQRLSTGIGSLFVPAAVFEAAS